MCDSLSLRSAFILAVAAMLTCGCDKAPKYQGEGPKMEFVRIPAGSFQMGSPATEEGRDDNEGPVHEVRITRPFYMGKYEVTQAQWKAVMGTTLRQQRDKADLPWQLKGEGPEHPMYYVSWEEAVEFCKRLGKKFRLPTEAEWEYACRAGSQTRFCYGDDPNHSELDQYAWYYGKSDNKTHPVGQKKPNAWGLYDMYGNVQEWCSDPYRFGTGYKHVEKAEPRKASSGDKHHVVRGGSWLKKPAECRSASRGFTLWNDTAGFRVVFAGKVRGDSDILKAALSQEATTLASAPEQSRADLSADGRLVTGVVRDEAGKPIDGLEMTILPQFWFLKNYAAGSFEAYGPVGASETSKLESWLVVRHMQRNLASVVEIYEDTVTLDVTLAPGVIVTGEVVGSDGKAVKNAEIVVRLQNTEWAKYYLTSLDADAEGRFEIRALPPGYDYSLSASKLHYRLGRSKVRSEDVHDNRVDGLSIVLPRGQFSVSGMVVHADGKPVADAWIWCSGENQIGINSRTDAAGRFKADGIFAGKVNVTASVQGDDGQWAGGSVIVDAGATDVRVVLGTGGWAPPPKGRACFPGETEVSENGAVVPISEVGRGRGIPRTPYGSIERIEEHEGAFECRDILLDSGNRISVVCSHCFMLDCGRWIAAQDLKAGLRLKTMTGTVGIKSVTLRPTPYVGKVYNLKISGSDRYAISKDGVIVRDY